MRAVTVSLFLFCASAAWAGAPAVEELKPITAVEAEKRVAETRDFLTDLLWLNTDGRWHTGRWEECIRLCRQIVQLDPRFIEAYGGAAWMLWSLDRDEEAVALYRAGIEANPDNWEIHHEFGMYYRHREKWNLAVEQFQKSVELGAPRYFQHMLPNTLERAGRGEEALEEWRALLARFPDDPIAKRHIESLEDQLRKKQKSVKVQPTAPRSG